MLPTKFQVKWHICSEEVQNRFSRWRSWLFNWNDFGYFDLQVTLILPTKFGVKWPFCSREVQCRFSRWQLWQPFLISNRKNIYYFLSTSCPNTSYQVSNQLAFRFRSRSSINIFPIRTILAIIYLQATPILPTKFQVNWRRSSK